MELNTQNRQCTFQIRAVPLPEMATRILDENSSLLTLIEQAQGREDRKAAEVLSDQTLDQIRHLREQLNEAFTTSGNSQLWNSDTVDEIWSFGPQKCGTNLLLNRIPNSIYKQRGESIWTVALQSAPRSNANTSPSKDEYDLSIVNGFQLATAKGSLCDEPLMGVAFIVERWAINTIVTDEITHEPAEAPETDAVEAASTTNPVEEIESVVETMSIASDESSTLSSQHKPRRFIDQSKVILKRGPLSGQIVSTIRDGCRKAFDSQPRRLVAAMYKCEIMVNAEALGKRTSEGDFLVFSHC